MARGRAADAEEYPLDDAGGGFGGDFGGAGDYFGYGFEDGGAGGNDGRAGDGGVPVAMVLVLDGVSGMLEGGLRERRDLRLRR